MTKLEHVAWYMLISAQVYAANGKMFGFAAFAVISTVCYVAAQYEKSR
jgi:hypothetical protein